MIGIDVVEIERLRRALERRGLEERLFTKDERLYCASKADPAVHLAGTLAAKEAVIKALSLGKLASWSRRIEIERDAEGRPVALLHEEASTRRLPVSISHDGGVAAAVALALPR